MSTTRQWVSYPVSLSDAEAQVGFPPATLPGKAPIGVYVVTPNYVVVLYDGPSPGERTEVRTHKDSTGVIQSETATLKHSPRGK